MTIKGWMTGYRTIPMSKLLKTLELSNYIWRDIEQNLISIKAGINHGEVKPKFPVMIDHKLGSIVGYILGDGSIDKKYSQVFFSNSNIELLIEFSTFMNKIFGVNPRIWVQKEANFDNTEWLGRVNDFNNIPNGHNVGLFYPKICGQMLHSICGKFAHGKTKKITSEIKNFDTDFKKGLIRAFFDSEGSVRSDCRTMRFYQDNRELLEEIRLMLEELGITSHEIRYYVKRSKLRHYFNITGFKHYYNYYHIIGCTSSRKAKEFELLITQVQNSKYFKKKFALEL